MPGFDLSEVGADNRDLGEFTKLITPHGEGN